VEVPGDNLICPEVGKWTEEKHSLVSMYAKLFSTGMKNKWETRVYIELYAGAGFSRIRDSSRIIAGSPIRALLLEDPFDKYIFCEKRPEEMEALKARASKLARSADISYILGDCNEQVQDIVEAIPVHSPGHGVLSLCFADPYDIGIRFDTFRKLSERYVDFLVLLALYSDANRSYKRYVMEDADKVDNFLGSETWRERWKRAEANGVKFPKFLAEEFAQRMETLGYLPTPIYRMKRVRSDEKNLPLYYIALFSRKPLAFEFWDDVLKYSTDQTAFDWS
jgi:three-Cys-motif partner protein